MTEMYRFETAQFIVRAVIVPDPDVDVSFDETGETAEKVASGEWQAFGTIVTVSHQGIVLGESSLWGSIYRDPLEFFTGHRGPDPMDRNCSTMKAARGANVCIGHYFPDMVREACGAARTALGNMPKVRAG